MHVDASVFKAYDIRGVVGRTIDERFAEQLGRAFGSEVLAAGDRAVAVGRDGRLSSPALAAALVRGLASTGLDVVDLGPVTTPMLYYVAATRGAHRCTSGVQVTGSHPRGGQWASGRITLVRSTESFSPSCRSSSLTVAGSAVRLTTA